MADFGSDFGGVSDLDVNWTFVSGDSSAAKPNSLTALSQALARRLTTPSGGLPYDPDYGYDVRDLVSTNRTSESAASLIEAECLKDERVDSCTCTITVAGSAGDTAWQIAVNCTTSTGDTFAFVLNVTAVSVELLTTGGGPITLTG